MSNINKMGMVARHAKRLEAGKLANLCLWFYETRSKTLGMRSAPIKLTIEPTTRCNLRCRMCLQSFWRPEFRGNMSFDDFKKVIDQFKHIDVLFLSGLGEPLMNRDIFRMIEYAKRAKKVNHLEFPTNAMLMDKENARRLIESGMDALSISLDGATKKTYDGIRRGADFNVVTRNISALVEMRGERRKPSINIGPTISSANAHEVLDMVRLAKELGADSVTLGDVNTDLIQKDDLGHISPEELKAEVAKLSREIGIDVTFFDERGDSCGVLWELPYITWDGYLIPCCFKPDPRVFNFGNVLETPFKELWNSAKMRRFRAEMRSRDVKPALCANCPHLMYRKGARVGRPML